MCPFLPRAISLLALLVACAVPAPCQVQGESGSRTAVVFAVQDLSGPGASNEYSQPITDTVVAALRNEGTFLIVPQAVEDAAVRSRSARARDLLGEPAALSVAEALEADLAVTGSYAIFTESGTEQIFLSLECWDVRRQEIVGGVQKRARFNLAFYSALHGWIAQLVTEISVGGDAAPSLKDLGSRLTISSLTFLSPDEGTEVLIGGDTLAGVIADGKLAFEAGPFPAGAPLRVELRKEGYHTKTVTVPVGVEVALPALSPEHRFAGEIGWTTGEALGLGGTFRAYLVPDGLHAWLSTTVFIQPPPSEAPRFVVHGDVSLGVAWYLFSLPGTPFRFTLGAGAGILLSAFTQPGFPLYTDFYLSLGRAGAELDLRWLVLFVRLDSRYALGLGENLLGRGWMQKGFPVATVGLVLR